MSGEDSRVGVLEITTSPVGDGRTRYQYDFTSPPPEPTLHLQAEALVEQASVDKFCDAVCTAVQTEADHRPSLRSLGGVLYRLVFPQAGRSVNGLKNALRTWTGPLIVKADGSAIPWELLHDGEAPGEGEFFGIRFSIGRQTGPPAAQVEQLGRVRRALLVCDPLGDLPEIRSQTLKLQEFLKGAGIECTLLDGELATEVAVLPALSDGTHDFFHYAGHVVRSERGGAGLALSDGPLLDDAIAEVLRQAPPAVFLIGCESVTHVSGLGRAFQDKGARIVVGTIYEPTDGGARDVAENFYFRLCRGAEAGVALQEAREAASQTSDGSWAAFVLLGDPTARFWPDQPTAQEPASEEAPVAEEADSAPVGQPSMAHEWWRQQGLPGQLDRAAADLVTTVLALASGSGVVTSWHLAVGLLGTKGSMLAEAAHEQGLDDLAEVFSLSFGNDDAEGDATQALAPGTGAVKLTDNATAVLARAASVAGDRDVITLDDLDQGFVASGGGSAGEMLRRLGIGVQEDVTTTKPSPFATDGKLRKSLISGDTLTSLAVAKLLSATQGQMVSSYSLLLALAFSGSEAVRQAFLAQGAAGERAVHILVDAPRTLVLDDISSRSFKALESALGLAGGRPVSDAELFTGLLAQEGSAARELLRRLGIDSDRLLASAADQMVPDRPPGEA